MLKSLSSQNASLPWPATEVVQRALPVFFQDISAGILVALKGRGLLIPQHKDTFVKGWPRFNGKSCQLLEELAGLTFGNLLHLP